MATPNRNGGAVAAVRLTDIDISVRRRYGRLLLERAIRELGPFGTPSRMSSTAQTASRP